MAQRLKLLQQHIAQPSKTSKNKVKTVESAFDYLSLADYLSPEQNNFRLDLRQLLEKQVIPKICEFVQSATFPSFLLPLLRQKHLLEYFQKDSEEKRCSYILKGVLIAELARADPGIATVFINTATSIDLLKQIGSKSQQSQLIPKLQNFQTTACCGLLQNIQFRQLGLKLSSKQNQEVLEGQINVTVADKENIACVWTRTAEHKLNGFIYSKYKNPQVKVKSENSKFGMRILTHQTLSFQKLKTNQLQAFQKNLDLKKSTIPIHLRLWICWMIAGICIGVYDNSIKYASQRTQFNRPISGFQLIQEKLVRLMATTQAIILTCVRIANLTERCQVSYVQAGLAKSWMCERARQVSRLGRQIYGGNGILHQNYSMRALADLQTIYSYSGTNQRGLIQAGKQLLTL